MKKGKLFTMIATLTLGVTALFGLTACGGETNTQTKSILFGKEVTTLTSQADILSGLDNGSCNLGVMDSVMAGYYAGTKADKYTKLDYVLSEENYVVAAKKGNKQLISELNNALIALKDTEVDTIADKYGLVSELNIPEQNPITSATDKSFEAVKTSGKVRIGYTEYAPIAFKENNELVGFDIEVPKAVVKYWNEKYNTTIKCEFIQIEWNQKETMLQNGSIDFAWNGLSWTQERDEQMELSVSYMKNKQVVVCKTADKQKYDELGNFLKNSKNAIISVEAGSNADDLMFMR